MEKCEKAVILGRIWYGYIVFQGSKPRGYRANCIHEYIYRCRQQKELCDSKWPGCKRGISRTIWGNTGILCRTFLFHPQNDMTEMKKLSVFLRCTGIAEDRWTMRNVDFRDEENFLKRYIKNLDKLFILSGFRIGSYIIWKVFTQRLRLREFGKG